MERADPVERDSGGTGAPPQVYARTREDERGAGADRQCRCDLFRGGLLADTVLPTCYPAGSRSLLWEEMMRTGASLVIAIVITGCAHRSTMEPRYINLPGRAVQAPFSDGVLVGNTLYLAGRIGLDPQTGRPPADASAEARLLLEQFRAVLAEAGMTMSDLVYVQVFCSDVTLFDTWNQVYRSFLSAPFPARAFLGSGPLLFGARFEMQAIAVKRR